MAQNTSGPANALLYDYAEPFDPRITGFNAPKGVLWRLVPPSGVGNAIVLQKQDNGFSTNWVPIGGGGGSVTGLPNTVAFYDNAGNISTDPNFTYFQTTQSVTFGEQLSGGVISCPSHGSEVHGQAVGSGTSLTANGKSSQVFGRAENQAPGVASASILTDVNATGSLAMGWALAASTGQNSQIMARGPANIVSAVVIDGYVQSRGYASFCLIESSGANITNDGYGSILFGHFSTCQSAIGSSYGAFMGGAVNGGDFSYPSAMNCTAEWAPFAFGFVEGFGEIRSSGNASFALGHVRHYPVNFGTSGRIISQGQASFVLADVYSGDVTAAGENSFVTAYHQNQGTITNSSNGGVLHAASVYLPNYDISDGSLIQIGDSIQHHSSLAFVVGVVGGSGKIIERNSANVDLQAGNRIFGAATQKGQILIDTDVSVPEGGSGNSLFVGARGTYNGVPITPLTESLVKVLGSSNFLHASAAEGGQVISYGYNQAILGALALNVSGPVSYTHLRAHET